MEKIDRRLIFILVALSIIIPILLKIMPKIEVSEPVLSAYKTVEQIPAGTPVIVSIDYDPASMPELQPMLKGILRHLAHKKLKIIITALWPLGAPLGHSAMAEIANEYNLKYGEDYVYLDYRPGGAAVILTMGREIRDIFSSDFEGTPIDSLPMMIGVHNYKDIGVVIGLEAGATGDFWAQAVRPQFGGKLILGSTAVVTPDLYPYYASGQLQGLLGGLRGASEYETLIKCPSIATLSMTPQSIAHALIIGLIIIGNISFLLFRKR